MREPFAPFTPAGGDGFSPIEIVDEPVHRVPREAARSGYRIYRARDGLEAAIPEMLVDQLVAQGRRAAPKEWFGLLVGHLFEDDRGRHVVVVAVVPDPEAEAEHSFVETSASSEFRTRTSARLLHPDALILGWAHGHVRHGARYSSTDRKTQGTWTQPHSIGIVVDPWDPQKLGVYRGPECEEMFPARTLPKRDDTLQIVPVPSRKEVAEDSFRARAIRFARRSAAPLGATIAVGCLVALVAIQSRLVRLEARGTRDRTEVVKLLRRIADGTRPPPAPVVPDARVSVSVGAWCVAGEQFGFRDDVVSAICFEGNP